MSSEERNRGTEKQTSAGILTLIFGSKEKTTGQFSVVGSRAAIYVCAGYDADVPWQSVS